MYLYLTCTCQNDLDHYAVNTTNIEQKQKNYLHWWQPVKQTIKYIVDLLPFGFLFFFRRYELLFLNCLEQTENVATDRQNLEETGQKTWQFGLKFACGQLVSALAHISD